MIWSSDMDVVARVGLTPSDSAPVALQTYRAEQIAYLTIGSSCDIRLSRAHVEALRDQLPDVLAAMDRVAADDAACEKAEVAGKRAVDAAAAALDQAAAAGAVGATDEAQAARAAAARATAAANEVDAKVEAMEAAAVEADSEADKALWAADQAARAVRRLHGTAVSTEAEPAGSAPEPCRP